MGQRSSIAQRVVRCAIGERKRRRRHEIHRLRKLNDARGIDGHFLGVAAVAGEGQHAHARLQAADALPDLADHTRHFPARGKRQRGPRLVLALNDENIEEVHAAGFHPDDDFAGSGRQQRHNRGIWSVLCEQRTARRRVLDDMEHRHTRIARQRQRRAVRWGP